MEEESIDESRLESLYTKPLKEKLNTKEKECDRHMETVTKACCKQDYMLQKHN
jgi:hypothetical protein